MNLLITSIGSFSAKFVINTCKQLGFIVFGTDTNQRKYLLNAKIVDHFECVAKSVNEVEYLEDITRIVKKNNIEFILPLTDLDVDFFSKYYSCFNHLDVRILVENLDLIVNLRYKDKLYDFLKDNQVIKCIPTFLKDNLGDKTELYPAIAKIKNGRSSENILFLNSDRDLFLVDENYIIQPLIIGQVVTVDILSDRNKHVWIQRKEHIRTKNGAGMTIEIVDIEAINNCVSEFLTITNYFGVLNIEFLVSENGDCYLMDVNPRFSAGVAFSAIAGYNFVKNAIKILLDNQIDDFSIDPPIGLVISKDYEEVVLK